MAVALPGPRLLTALPDNAVASRERRGDRFSLSHLRSYDEKKTNWRGDRRSRLGRTL